VVSAKEVAARTERRSEAGKKLAQKEQEINKLLQKYDTNRDGHLDDAELGGMLADCNGGVRPSEEEIAWVRRVADKRDNHMDGTLKREDVETAVTTWQAYRENQAQIDDVFVKYDKDGNGSLEFADLKLMLTDLNDGVPPDDEEVSLILRKADEKDGEANGYLSRMEVIYAVAIWYARVEVRMQEQAGSACCVVA